MTSLVEKKIPTLQKLPLKLMSNIMKNCATIDLLTLRHVNSELRALASLALRDRWEIQINLDHHSYSESAGGLTRFISLLEDSQLAGFLGQFPCAGIHLRILDLRKLQVQKLFTIYGHRIKFMSIYFGRGDGDCDHDDCDVSRLKNVLLNQAPNIESLKVSDYHRLQYSFQKPKDFSIFFHSQIILPKLKKFCVKSSTTQQHSTEQVELDILKAAINLKELKNFGHFKTPAVQNFVIDRKILTVKKMTFRPTRSNIEFYEKFEAAGPKLKKLTLDLSSCHSKDLKFLEKVEILIVKLLHGCKNSLVKIGQFQSSSNCLKNMQQWPVCEKVDEFRANYFDADFVQREKYFSKILNFFPHLRKLTLFPILNLPMVCKEVFKTCKNLETLELLGVRLNSAHNRYPALDATFTGFSEETCFKLAVLNKNGKISFVTMLRTSVSILEMKKLTSLTIELTTFPLDQKDEWTKPMLTQVSQIYAFDILRELKVRVVAKGNFSCDLELKNAASDALATVAPFVDSVELSRE